MNTSVKIDFVFEFGVNNGSMSLIMKDKDRILSEISDSKGLVEISHFIDFPNQLTIEVSGKTANDTTILNGEIIADKYIRLVDMKVGCIPVTEPKFFSILNYEHDGKTYYDPYWGFNGRITIDFNSDDFIKWHLSNQNVFDLV